LGLSLPASGSQNRLGGSSAVIELLIKTAITCGRPSNTRLADEIRTRLAELGIILEDTPRGTVWSQRGKLFAGEQEPFPGQRAGKEIGHDATDDHHAAIDVTEIDAHSSLR